MRSSRRSLCARVAVLTSLVALLLSGVPTQLVPAGSWPGLSAVAGWLHGLVPNTAGVARAADAVAQAGAPAAQAPGAASTKAAGPPKRVRELVDERAANAKVFALSNGRRQVVLSAGPRHYRDDGKWREINTTVRAAEHKRFSLANTTNRFTTRFSTHSDKLVRFKLDGKHVTLGLAGEKRKLSPRVEGSTVTYPDALASGELSYAVTGSAVKERITLSEAPKAPVWKFSLRMGGVTARELADGSIGFFAKGKAASGRPVFVMPAPFMYDSAEVAKSTHGGVVSQQVSQAVEQRGANFTITVRADAGWLGAEERVYPVTIDPTIKVAPTPTMSQDVQIWSDTPNRNDAYTYQLSVGTDAWGAARALLRFDTSMIPDGANLSSAQLRLYYDSELWTNSNNVAMEVRRITRGWSQGTATWNSMHDGFDIAGNSTDVKQAGAANTWNEWDVTTIAQSWVSGAAANHGLMVKAVDESLDRGGAVYQSASFAYNSEIATYPQLVINYGRPSAVLAYPTTIHSTGAELHWQAYDDPNPNASGDDIVEYQVHRSVYQTFTPSAATLVAPLDPGRTSFTDTTAEPTPVDSDKPFGNAYYYQVAVKTRDGQLVAGPTQVARLPKAGRTTKILLGASADATIASNQPSMNLDTLGGSPWLMPGNNSWYYGNTRALMRFDQLAEIPDNASVVDAELGLWAFYSNGSWDTVYDAHALTRGFDADEVTWNRAAAGQSWSSPGGDMGPALDAGVSTVTNDPKTRFWNVASAVQGWIADPASNHGFAVKVAAEGGAAQQRALFLSSEADEEQLRPNLVVTYTTPTAASTYYAPETPSMRMIPGDTYTVDVTVTNTTNTVWRADERVLSYHWRLPDGSDVTTGGNRLDTALPQDVAPGESVTVAARVKTPIQSDSGNKREQFVLAWDLYNTADGTWFSDTGSVPALAQPVTVEDPTSDQLGLEGFYSYTGAATGAGSNALVNQYAGNTVFSYDAFTHPGRGLSTFLRLSYNSMDTSATAAGYGWSVAASGITRLGTKLALHPKHQDYPKTITLPDGDGTSHVFELNTHGSKDPAQWSYDSPAGVQLHLQRQGGDDPTRRWVMTRPDDTRFYFDAEGWLSAVVDRNGNTQTYTYVEKKSRNQPTKFLAYVTDPAGRKTLELDYWRKKETKNPKWRGQLQSVTDITGRQLTFTYDDKGLLTKIVDGAGSTQPKVFEFTYDATQGTKNVKLVAVTDPRGNTTKLDYYTAPEDPKDKWKLQTLTDREGHATTVSYADPDGSAGSQVKTTVTNAAGNASTYLIDGYGRPTEVTNANGETTTMAWDADNNVVALTEANGATTEWRYNSKTGYPTSIRTPEAVAAGDPATRMEYATSLNGYVANLTAKTSPEGHRWEFGYDSRGNLTRVTDPAGVASAADGDYTTTYTYDEYGRLVSATDANGNTTTFGAFHATGFPKTVTDALDNTTTTTYDQRGHVLSVTDPLGAKTTLSYDIFGRPLETTTPKDASEGEFITTPAPVYDPNDNVIEATAPNGAVSTATYNANDRTVASTMPKDTAEAEPRKTAYVYDALGRLASTTGPLGTLTPNDPDDHQTSYVYDPIGQLASVTNAAGDTIAYAYDNVGNLISTTGPRGTATAEKPDDYTTTFSYDRNHRRLSTTDTAGNTTRTTYDVDGNVVATTDQTGVTTQYSYSARGTLVETRQPHSNTLTRITRFAYDEVGNRTRVISPRGVATENVGNDFTTETVYDALNRPVKKLAAFDPNNPRYGKPATTRFTYNAAGRLTKVSAPPSAGQSVRNETSYSYFDNGWIQNTTSPWGITTSYDYNPLGKQTARTITAAGGSSSRTMSWDYYPDGKLKARSDEGIPAGLKVALADNSDTPDVATTGDWTTSSEGAGFQGYDYAVAPENDTSASFTWEPTVPKAGDYEVFVKYPDTATATTAEYTVHPADGTDHTVSIDQTQKQGQWVSLGSYQFDAGSKQTISLSGSAEGTVVADAVKLVRAKADTDTKAKKFTYNYDAAGHLTRLEDTSSGAAVDAYTMGYTGLGQLAQVQEHVDGAVTATSSYTYGPAGNLLTRDADAQDAEFTYSVRNLLAKVTNTQADREPKTTTFAYTPRGQKASQVKPNGNTVTFDYHLDGLLAKKVEKQNDGTLVARHVLDYNRNGHRTRDASKVQNADDPTKYLDVVRSYTYDPRDRISKVTKTDAATGSVLETESYVHDANSNVIEQTVDGVNTTYTYDRNRLVSATANGVTAGYNYDPYGRLLAVKSGGQVIESRSYDSFGRTVEHTTLGDAGDTVTTSYAYDPLDRTTSKTTGAGTASAETTEFDYLGLSSKVIAEEIGGQVQRSYTYSAWGKRLSMLKHDTDGTGGEQEQRSFYGYNPHTDVETLTTKSGETRATYGYTAYGSNDTDAFTGIDTPQPDQPGVEEPYNPYRFNHKRFDATSGSYDMGFRSYDPGTSRFTSRDLYLGARANMGLTADGFTGNRYAFTAGNPITGIELDGHKSTFGEDGGCPCIGLGGVEIDDEGSNLSPQELEQVRETRAYNDAVRDATDYVRNEYWTLWAGANGINQFTGEATGRPDQVDVGLMHKLMSDYLCSNAAQWVCDRFSAPSTLEIMAAAANRYGPATAGAAAMGAAGVAVGKITRGLARSGLVAPRKILFSQGSISPTFKNGKSVDDLAAGLRSGAIRAQDVPAVRLVNRDGKLYTLDNRRLVAFQKAGVPVQFRMATSREIRNENWKFNPIAGGTSIKVRGGGGTWTP